MNSSVSDKKPGIGSLVEPVVLIVLAVGFGTCAGSIAGGRVGGMSFEEEGEKRDPVKDGEALAAQATVDSDARLKAAFDEGIVEGKAVKLKELEAQLDKLSQEDKSIWTTTIEKNAIESCTSYYMKGVNDGEKAYETAFRWEYQVPVCKEGMITTKLKERLQLYHGQIPVGQSYERNISEELWGDCEQMSKHYLDTVRAIKQLNLNQNVEWEVQKKEVTVTQE